MPPINRRPSTPYRPSSRPSAPSYNRRANSTRRDIRMDNRRRRSNTPTGGPRVAIIALIIVVGIIFDKVANKIVERVFAWRFSDEK